jgi:DNA-binding transcriptional ArsR family regulator
MNFLRWGLAFRPHGAIVNPMVQFQERLDGGFAALSDPTRRAILERLGRGDASISELSERFGMTLTGIKKHVSVLESAELLTTEKVGRVRRCSLGPRRLEDERAWIESYRKMLEDRFDRLDAFLERTKGKQP